MVLVFSLFILSPIFEPNVSMLLVSYCIPASALLSTDLQSPGQPTSSFWPHSITKLASSIALVMTKTIMMKKRKGERMQPRITPVSMSNISVFPTPVFTQQLELRLCIEYVNEFVRDPVKFQYFPE